jgi:alanine dehydrogenase
MRIFDGAKVEAALSYPALVDILQAAFARGAVMPTRHHHPIALEGRPEAMILLMPAWETSAPGAHTAGRFLGVKSVTVFPDNATRGKPAIYGTYLLGSAETGETLAVMDATTLTAWRTAAASALAARYLARPDATRLVMVGAGALAPCLIRAHAAVRPIRHVQIWNRSRARAEKLAARLADTGLPVSVTEDLEGAVREADVISTATLSAEPLVQGAWLKPGAHLDCVGAYRPSMRETDDEAVRRARVFVDTHAGAFAEAGDLLQPLAAGVVDKTAVLGDLFDLCRSTVPGRATADEITMFKSVGAAIEDLAAAIAVYEHYGA